MPNGKTVLIVEDDPNMRGMLNEVLTSAGFTVVASDRIDVGLGLFETTKPDLLILDVNLPDGNGLQFCRKVREHKTLSATPVIMLTGNSQLDEKSLGFAAGADQYLTKPIIAPELLLWVEALMRRLALDKEEGPVLDADDLHIDKDSHMVKLGDLAIPNLTGKEFDLLYYLVKSRPKVLSRKNILSKLWHTITVDHVVDTHIANLRRKVPPQLAARIQAVPGKGFRYFAP